MKSHIVLVSLGLSIFYLWGCTPAGKSYWLAYEVDKTMAPASTYKGYYRDGSGWLDSFCQFISGTWRIADYAAVYRVVRLT